MRFIENLQAAKRIGCQMIYIAMFDEVDEATADFKCTNQPPVGEDVSFLAYEGLPSDHYLKLAGRAGRLLRSDPATQGRQLERRFPRRPTAVETNEMR